jgi:hypothetical protein
MIAWVGLVMVVIATQNSERNTFRECAARATSQPIPVLAEYADFSAILHPEIAVYRNGHL